MGNGKVSGALLGIFRDGNSEVIIRDVGTIVVSRSKWPCVEDSAKDLVGRQALR